MNLYYQVCHHEANCFLRNETLWLPIAICYRSLPNDTKLPSVPCGVMQISFFSMVHLQTFVLVGQSKFVYSPFVGMKLARLNSVARLSSF